MKLRNKLANYNYSYIHTYFYCNSLKGRFSYKTIKQENCKKKESITVIHKNDNYKMNILNEIKLVISNPVLIGKMSFASRFLNMLTESVDLTLSLMPLQSFTPR